MFNIKILTESKLERLLQAERDRAFAEAVDCIVDLCKQKEKIYLDTVEVHGDHNAIAFDSIFLGCETGVKIFPNAAGEFDEQPT